MAEAQPAPGREECLPDEVVALLPAYLARQRWYAGDAEGARGLRVTVASRLATGSDGAVLHWLLVDAAGERYQLLVGQRPNGYHAAFLNGREEAAIGSAGDSYYYDAVVDSDLSVQLLSIMTNGLQPATRVRPITAEQSNSSLVFDDQVIVKLFRRLSEGPNLDAEVTSALAGAGFASVPTPVARWRWDGTDLAFAEEYLAGGTEGWALAHTSLRDFYNSESDDPAEAGGDFAGEASRLGRVTAELHLALASLWGARRGPAARAVWDDLVAYIAGRLPAALAELGADAGAGDTLVERLRTVTDPGPLLRVHGDYHLGQVMRTDSGWYVLDFEGEPARPVEERSRASCPLKDVAGMLRSFDYAAWVGLREFGEAASGRAEAWEAHNRRAFLDGYLATEGIDGVLPAAPDRAAVLAANEMEKALYELDYERAYRPSWVEVPAGAIGRILAKQRG